MRFKVEACEETTGHKSSNITVVVHSSFYRQIKRVAAWFSELLSAHLSSDNRSNLPSSGCLEFIEIKNMHKATTVHVGVRVSK